MKKNEIDNIDNLLIDPQGKFIKIKEFSHTKTAEDIIRWCDRVNDFKKSDYLTAVDYIVHKLNYISIHKGPKMLVFKVPIENNKISKEQKESLKVVGKVARKTGVDLDKAMILGDVDKYLKDKKTRKKEI